jgi:hypothetical protein
MDVDLNRFLMAIPGNIINWKGVPKGLFRRAMSGILPEAIRQRRWKADFTALNNAAVAASYSEFQGYWQPDCRTSAAGYTDRTILASQLAGDRFDRNNRMPAAQTLDIEALELWLRVFWR